ncbi:hypothetical protein P43SY_005327 [Pythium insidiosum]|uniref:DUF4833 domain-containing protein n=1 Tax=Pythium insidiosum TaxID=114742 RepID=A0AAD5LN05_PYTIN|nr:hypothetical protein P43SY_005327 [Pythium insidiosum]
MSKLSNVHVFTEEFPDKDYRPTTASPHPQTKFWPAYLPVEEDRTTINGVASRLWKVFVCTNNTMAFIPKVLYVDLYGTNVESGEDTYERINVAG